jgi:hypothetical protein
MYNDVMMSLSWLSPIALLLGILGAIVHRQKLKRIHWFIFTFLFISLLFDISSRIIMSWFKLDSNLSVFSLYVFVEYLFLGILYNQFFPTKSSKLLLYSTFIGGGIILLIMLSNLTPIIPTHYQLYEGLVANFFCLFFGLFFIYKLLVEDLKTSSQLKTLNNIVIMYAGIQFFMALTINFMVNMAVELVTTFWIIRLFATILFYTKLSHILWQPGKMVTQ